jgi:hypothetical protein
MGRARLSRELPPKETRGNQRGLSQGEVNLDGLKDPGDPTGYLELERPREEGTDD